ncbi:MAG: hypothetical protein K5683_11920 [Prevotella sp.]|nr:hypothetical protein [Prevotella sp.]
MKRIVLGISIATLCLLISSCSKLGKIESLSNDAKEKGKSWTTTDWVDFMNNYGEAVLAFWESMPSKEDIKEYERLDKRLNKTMERVIKSKKAEKAYERALKKLKNDREFKRLVKDTEKAERRARKAIKGNSRRDRDDDDDDDDADENYDDADEDYDESEDYDE